MDRKPVKAGMIIQIFKQGKFQFAKRIQEVENGIGKNDI